MRQISTRNKKTFSIFTVLIMIVVACIALMLFQNAYASQVYPISMNSVVYDINGNYVDVSSEGNLKKQWNNEYTLSLTNGNSYKLGKNSVIKSGNNLQVYGGGYRVFEDGSVKTLSEQIEITNTNTTGLYKLRDRQYLLVGKNIVMENNEFTANQYITVDLDKSGNAYLRNDKVNFKAVAPIVLVSDDTTFDVSNEKLKIADTSTDLKKINGSTNEYIDKNQNSEESTNPPKKDEDSNSENVSSDTSSGSSLSGDIGGSANSENGTGNTGLGSGDSSSNVSLSGLDNLNNIMSDFIDGFNDLIHHINGNGNSNSSTDVNEKSSMVLNSVSVGITSLTVDYSISDTKNQYKSVFVKVTKSTAPDTDPEKTKILYLNKSETKKEVFNLYPDKAYSITLGYTDSKGEEQVIDIVSVRTKKINAEINVNRIVDDTLYFNLKLSDDFLLESGNIVVYNDNTLGTSIPIDISAATSSKGWSSTLVIDKSAGQYTIKLEDTVFDENGTKTDINISAETVISNTWYDKIIRALFG